MEMNGTINTRFKLLRQQLNLSQEQFGSQIGLTKASVSNIENSIRNVNDRTIMLLESTFHVNVDWLRTGNGSMFKDVTDDIDMIAQTLHLDDFQVRLLRLIHSMPIEQQKLVQQMAHQLAGDEPPETDAERRARIARAALAEHDRQQEQSQENKRA